MSSTSTNTFVAFIHGLAFHSAREHSVSPQNGLKQTDPPELCHVKSIRGMYLSMLQIKVDILRGIKCIPEHRGNVFEVRCLHAVPRGLKKIDVADSCSRCQHIVQ